MAGYHKAKLGPDEQNDEGSKMSKKSTVNHVPGFMEIVGKFKLLTHREEQEPVEPARAS